MVWNRELSTSEFDVGLNKTSFCDDLVIGGYED